MIYEPREDSLLLAKYVAVHARGRTLDMGTGSGIQARTARQSPRVTEVLAVDIDPEAVAQLQGELPAKESDLFSSLSGEQFDTIICNPPYLPQDHGVRDSTIYGGSQGYEFLIKFFKEARDHLTDDGQILVLFSSLTNKELLDRTLREFGYHWEPLGELAMFFERLHVYRLWL